MTNSMWRCSGWSWVKIAYAWAAVCLAVPLMAEFSPDEPVEAVAIAAPSHPRLAFAGPLSESAAAATYVSIQLKSLDLADIDPAAFGDADERIASMTSAPVTK